MTARVRCNREIRIDGLDGRSRRACPPAVRELCALHRDRPGIAQLGRLIDAFHHIGPDCSPPPRSGMPCLGYPSLRATERPCRAALPTRARRAFRCRGAVSRRVLPSSCTGNYPSSVNRKTAYHTRGYFARTYCALQFRSHRAMYDSTRVPGPGSFRDLTSPPAPESCSVAPWLAVLALRALTRCRPANRAAAQRRPRPLTHSLFT